MPKAYEVDFAVVRAGRVIGVAEVKVRRRQHSDLLLSMRKGEALRRFAARGLHARLVVAVPQGVFVYRVATNDRPELCMGGRSDRGDPDDQEPMERYPWAGMRRVCDAPSDLFKPLRGLNVSEGAWRAS